MAKKANKRTTAARAVPPANKRKSAARAVPPVEVTVEAIPEGKVVDFLTGRFVKDTPEEYVRQNIEKALVRQYRYDPIDCEPEFKIKVGSDKKRVDVSIFYPGKPHLQENAIIAVEAKKAGTNPAAKVDGIEQLKSYMAVCVNAKYGLWTNGDDRFCFAKRIVKGKVEFEQIVDIPAFGQTEEDAYQPTRKDLMPATADNLLFAFRRCHNYIAGTEGMQKAEAFWELLKVIFSKIEDERSGQKLRFFAKPDEIGDPTSAAPAKARIQKLFTETVVNKYPRIFPSRDHDISLKANVLAFVVSQIQRFSLLESPVDVKGVAYEEIVGSNLRGDRGEFFTPRNACRMAVRMLDPQCSDMILDPACGTGGFLITAMNHALVALNDAEREMWLNPPQPSDAERAELYRKRAEFLNQRLFGIDLNPALVRAAKMNMVMNNDGEGSLFQGNSLANPHTWDSELRQRVRLGTYDLIFTNPPFGANILIDDEQILRQYDLAAVWEKEKDTWKIKVKSKGERHLQKSQPPEILFIERCIQFLKPGTGKMAMVIPNGILNNPALGYVRTWILQNCQVIAVVDMARELFQPKNDTQTSMVLLRRLDESEKREAARRKLDYSVFMAVAEKIGHDKRGSTIFRRTATGDDVLVTRTETIPEVDRATGRESVRTVEIKERLIDDELPEVAETYLEWLVEVEK